LDKNIAEITEKNVSDMHGNGASCLRLKSPRGSRP